MTRYLAITIGPVVDTILKAAKTRELWVASYLFSQLLEEIHGRLEKSLSQHHGKILSPLPAANQSNKSLYGAGIFPDRLFARAGTLQPADVNRLVTAAVEEIALRTLPDLSKKDLTVQDDRGNTVVLSYHKIGHEGAAKAFWKKYLRVESVWQEIDPKQENPLLVLNALLDTAELKPVYFPVEPDTDYALALLDFPYKTDFAKALHQRGNYKRVMATNSLFPSTAEIAAYELFQDDETGAVKKLLYGQDIDSSEEPREDLEEFFSAISSHPATKGIAADYHKYYCIVHADGDGFGDVLKSLNDESAIATFSQNLSQFAADAAELIDRYAGKPVYVGGDDLLFFSPLRAKVVINGKGKVTSVFETIQKLDELFDVFIKRLNLAADVLPTMSYGISISYYKHPLFEAYQTSFDQLKERAKQYKSDYGDKNVAAFRLLKHSGSYFDGILTKKQLDGLMAVLGMIDEIPDDLFSSVAYKLDTLGAMLNKLVETGAVTSERIEALFANYFDEPVHRRNPRALAALQGLTELIFDVPKAAVDGKSLKAAENLYAILRLLNFMVSARNKNISAHA